MGILDDAKVVAGLVKKYNDRDLYEKIVDLRDEIITLKENNLKMRERISQLESEANTKDNLIYDAPFYWLVQDDKRDGPFCQKCNDSNGKKVRLQNEGNDCWQCLECEGFFEGADYIPSEDDKGTDLADIL